MGLAALDLGLVVLNAGAIIRVRPPFVQSPFSKRRVDGLLVFTDG